jgi:hypothetical protein
MTTWDNIIDARLVDVYGVDDATLKDNRRGRMTETQRSRLKGLRWRRIALLGRSLIIALLLYFLLGRIPLTGFLAALMWFPRALLLLIVLIQTIRIFHFYRRSSGEIAEGKVRMYPGRLSKVVWYGIRILFCERGEFYYLPNREWEAFDHQGRYRVYCTPYTKVILAAQPVHRDEPLPEAWRRDDDKF